MAATPSVKMEVSFTFDGTTKVWSNRYHFTNDSPTTDARWDQFFDNIVAQLKIPLPPSNTIVGAVGYDAGSDLPRRSKAYSQPGIYAIDAGDFEGPGDSALLLKWLTDARTSKNHPIYLFNYMHGVVLNHLGPPGKVASGQRSRYNDFQIAWDGGISDGVVNHRRCGPNGAVGTRVNLVEPRYVTHRDFPR